ncbi:MAG: S41 family peptidase [Flavobacteriaceae bacterium]|nr:S41 family peptidase [Flavobacteriaceae bacterium]
MLESNVRNWETGEIRFYATHTTGNKYNVFDYNITTRSPSMKKSISFENGRLLSYKKVNNTLNHEFAPKENKFLEFKELIENVQYLYFKNFFNKKRKVFKPFYKEVKSKLTAKNIIVDLRSNGGGNKKLSDPFLKLLKGKNVFIITNSFTASNAEQFTVKLKKIKNAIHLGQVTMGGLSYGMNYGYDYPTPSGFFRILPTDMNFHKYYKYEGKGVAPDIALSFDKDWIEQTLEIIKNNN